MLHSSSLSPYPCPNLLHIRKVSVPLCICHHTSCMSHLAPVTRSGSAQVEATPPQGQLSVHALGPTLPWGLAFAFCWHVKVSWLCEVPKQSYTCTSCYLIFWEVTVHGPRAQLRSPSLVFLLTPEQALVRCGWNIPRRTMEAPALVTCPCPPVPQSCSLPPPACSVSSSQSWREATSNVTLLGIFSFAMDFFQTKKKKQSFLSSLQQEPYSLLCNFSLHPRRPQVNSTPFNVPPKFSLGYFCKNTPHSSISGWKMYVLCHYILEAYNLPFDFTGDCSWGGVLYYCTICQERLWTPLDSSRLKDQSLWKLK